jgi:hypothetical protein
MRRWECLQVSSNRLRVIRRQVVEEPEIEPPGRLSPPVANGGGEFGIAPAADVGVRRGEVTGDEAALPMGADPCESEKNKEINAYFSQAQRR